MRLGMIGTWLVVIAVLASAPAAFARPGSLDRSFGKHGKVAAATWSPIVESREPEPRFALAPRSEIVAARGRTILKYLPNGRLDRRFGRAGRIPPNSTAGVGFVIAGLAVDSKGRIVVAGASATNGEYGFPRPYSSPNWVAVSRYLPDGRLDPSFGSDGTVTSTLGLPPPDPYTPVSPTGESGPEIIYASPLIRVSGVTVDDLDRPIISGSRVKFFDGCDLLSRGTPYLEAFVARLTPSGAMDLSFNGSGLLRIPDREEAREPQTTSMGRLYYIGEQGVTCERNEQRLGIDALTIGGTPDAPFFGTAGRLELPQFSEIEVAVGPRGRILVLSQDLVSDRVRRVTPSGGLESRFGRKSSRVLRRNRLESPAIAADRRGHILVAGSLTTPRHRSAFLVLKRLQSSGALDRGFGKHGTVRTEFGRRAFASATQILVDARNRILVAGALRSPALATGRGIAITRYLGGR